MSRLFNTSSFRAPVGRNEPGAKIDGLQAGDKPADKDIEGAPVYNRIRPDGTVILSLANARALTDLLDKVKKRADVGGWRPYTPLARGK
jgi:hypothetical protein